MRDEKAVKKYQRTTCQVCLAWYAFCVAFFIPFSVHAEPAASQSHLPFLWLLAAAVSGLLSWIVIRIITRTGHLATAPRKWGLMAVLFIVFLVFVSPIIVALGSILITGRTM